MRVFVLRVVDDESVPYDGQCGVVVMAASEANARRMAADAALADHENAELWLDDALSSCEEVSATGDQRVIMRRFRVSG